MNWVHIHLLLNHLPVIGIVLVIPILAWGFGRRSEEVIRLGLVLLAALAAVTIVVYVTGEPAEEAAEGLAGVSESLIERHEEAALLATSAFAAIGALALGGLIRFRRRPIPRRFAALVLALALIPAGMVGWTANLGGQIRHTEIRPGVPAESSPVASGAVGD
jgi:hypothetical protein